MLYRRAVSKTRPSAGFTMIELVVVVGIIMVIAATGLPAISRYIRNFQIRGASQQVASEITTARGKAIMKNVNYGVSFLVLSNNTYRYAIEDMPGKPTRIALGTVLTDAQYASQLGPVRTLPSNVVFGTGCVDNVVNSSGSSTSTTFVGNDSGFRFTRYGAHCDPGGEANTTTTEPCPKYATGVGLLNSVMNVPTTGGALVCLTQDINGDGVADLRRVVNIAPGGRVVQR